MSPIEQALRELVALKAIKDKYEHARPDSPRHQQWKQYLADVDGFAERWIAAWEAARSALSALEAPQPVGEPIIGHIQWTPGSEPSPELRATLQDMVTKAARSLGVSEAAPAGWISVEDRLPEPDSGEVLVWLSGGRCAFDEWHMHREDPTGMSTTHTLEMGLMWRDYEFEDITHWMPLPAAPSAPTPSPDSEPRT